MKTSPYARIQALTEAGRWSEDSLHDRLARHAAERPDALAVKDRPDRQQLAGEPPLEALQRYLLDRGFVSFKLPERIERIAQLLRNPLGPVHPT